MSRRLGLLALALLLGFVLPGSGRTQNPAPKSKTVRLLTVGNSFSGNATTHLNDLAKAAGHTLVHRPMSIGGASMATHWAKVEKNEADPKDPAGLYGGKSLKAELQAEPWDFVTVQQASIQSHDVNTYRPHAGRLRDYIKKHAPKAELLVHQTWAYRADDPRFARENPPKGEPTTRQEMHDSLTKAYETIAAELGARIIPSGDAFNLAETDAKWGYKIDKAFKFDGAVPPALPDQAHSLHTGWRWGKGKDAKDALGIDGHHASQAGQYLAGCVWLEVLFGESPVGNTFVPAMMDPAYARFLQETAHKAVTDRKAKKSPAP